ncbi:MAG: hypothetical protein WCS96_12630 [Victivallales bacterium]
MKKARAIQKAIANPQHIEPEQLLNEIDGSFRNMSETEKKKLLQDPVATEKHIADATYEELDKSFKLLFTLPSSIREKVIRESADDLRRKALENPEKVAEFFESPGGNGALRGASKFFLLELSGSQKAESAPLTQAMYEIVRDQAKAKKKGKR